MKWIWKLGRVNFPLLMFSITLMVLSLRCIYIITITPIVATDPDPIFYSVTISRYGGSAFLWLCAFLFAFVPLMYSLKEERERPEIKSYTDIPSCYEIEGFLVDY